MYEKFGTPTKIIFWFFLVFLTIYFVMLIGLGLYLLVNFTEISSYGIFINYAKSGCYDTVSLITSLLGIDDELNGPIQIIQSISFLVYFVALSKAIYDIKKSKSNINTDKYLLISIVLSILSILINYLTYGREFSVVMLDVSLLVINIKLYLDVLKIQKLDNILNITK